MIPTIHLNGSDGEQLRDGLLRAGLMLAETIGMFDEAAPNARDFYVQGPDAYAQAMREHKARMEQLSSVRDEMMRLIEGVQSQLDARATSKR